MGDGTTPRPWESVNNYEHGFEIMSRRVRERIMLDELDVNTNTEGK